MLPQAPAVDEGCFASTGRDLRKAASRVALCDLGEDIEVKPDVACANFFFNAYKRRERLLVTSFRNLKEKIRDSKESEITKF